MSDSQIMTTQNPTSKDPTAAKRAAALKKRLQENGGCRMSLNLDGKSVKKLNRLVKSGKGNNLSEVIRVLINDA